MGNGKQQLGGVCRLNMDPSEEIIIPLSSGISFHSVDFFHCTCVPMGRDTLPKHWDYSSYNKVCVCVREPYVSHEMYYMSGCHVPGFLWV